MNRNASIFKLSSAICEGYYTKPDYLENLKYSFGTLQSARGITPLIVGPTRTRPLDKRSAELTSMFNMGVFLLYKYKCCKILTNHPKYSIILLDIISVINILDVMNYKNRKW